MSEPDIAAWQMAGSCLRQDADAGDWLIARLARDPNGATLASLPDKDRAALVGGIRAMHDEIYGVRLAVWQTRAKCDIAECIDCYADARLRFADAIALGERMCP